MEYTYDQHPPDKDFGPTILIVDDEALARKTLETVCSLIEPRGSYRTIFASTVSEALQMLTNTAVDVVLLDKNIGPDENDPAQNGIERIPEFIKLQPHLQILMVTGSSELKDVVRAITLGAFNYVVKGSPTELLTTQIKQAVSISKLTQEKIRGDRTRSKKSINFMAGNSEVMVKTRERLQGVTETRKPVLLLGETGTGKTTAAKIIHEMRQQYLKQTERSFVALNMAAVSSSMAEGELFGNEAGAYTDAKQARPGYFELANHGTLFLDEIGEASLELQAKLLKVLDDGKFYRLGGKREMTSNFKLVCATNRDLEKMVEEGTFRADLHARISTFQITIPPLSQRREDIPQIIENLLPRCCEENQIFIQYEDLPSDFIEFCQNTSFEGNIRGLDQALSRLLVYAPKDRRGRPQLRNWRSIIVPTTKKSVQARGVGTTLTLEDLTKSSYDVVDENFPGLDAVLAKVTENIFKDAFSKYPKHKDAAQVLGLSPPNLTYKKKSLGLGKESPAHAELGRLETLQ